MTLTAAEPAPKEADLLERIHKEWQTSQPRYDGGLWSGLGQTLSVLQGLAGILAGLGLTILLLRPLAPPPVSHAWVTPAWLAAFTPSPVYS